MRAHMHTSGRPGLSRTSRGVSVRGRERASSRALWSREGGRWPDAAADRVGCTRGPNRRAFARVEGGGAARARPGLPPLRRCPGRPPAAPAARARIATFGF